MKSVTSAQVDGLLLVDKPPALTSMAVVRQIKRLTRVPRVGHAGTLDPIATGLLPICLGQATRIMEYLVDTPKSYRARVRLGIATDTYDSTGKVLEEHDPSAIDRHTVEALLPQFTGVILQQPPMFSALKHEGRRLYDLARAGMEVERPARRVKVFRLELTEWAPPFFTLEVQCGRGMYMRSLAHDLGHSLGCGAHLHSLVRLRIGPFSLEESATLAQFEQAVHEGRWQQLIKPPDSALLHLAAMNVDRPAEHTLRNGQPIPVLPTIRNATHLEQRRVYGMSGHFVAIVRLHRAEGVWQPLKIFRLTTPSPFAPASAV